MIKPEQSPHIRDLMIPEPVARAALTDPIHHFSDENWAEITKRLKEGNVFGTHHFLPALSVLNPDLFRATTMNESRRNEIAMELELNRYRIVEPGMFSATDVQYFLAQAAGLKVVDPGRFDAIGLDENTYLSLFKRMQEDPDFETSFYCEDLINLAIAFPGYQEIISENDRLGLNSLEIDDEEDVDDLLPVAATIKLLSPNRYRQLQGAIENVLLHKLPDDAELSSGPLLDRVVDMGFLRILLAHDAKITQKGIELVMDAPEALGAQPVPETIKF